MVLQLVMAATELKLVVQRVQELPSIEIDIKLTRSPGASWGFGFVTDAAKTDSKVISAVTGGGLAEGKLEKGDVIISMNGMAVASLPHDMVLQLVQAASELNLKITRVNKSDGGGRASSGGDGGAVTQAPSSPVFNHE